MKRPLTIALALLMCSWTSSVAGGEQTQSATGDTSPPRQAIESGPDSQGELVVHFIDVGQGDAIFVQSPDGRSVLVDAGPPEGSKAILDLMRKERITSLDLVIATHPHFDHIGGLQTILESVPVRYYMDPGYPHSSRTYEALLETLQRLKIPVLNARSGRNINLGGGASIRILAPADPLHQGTRSDANSNSIVSRIQFRNFTVLLAGDAEAPTEEGLTTHPDIQSKVLKVSHHGSRHSSQASFIKAVAPEVAVIQVGGSNRYGHPHPDALNRLEEAGARIYRNDLHGTITIRSDGNSYVVSTEKRPSARLRVEGRSIEKESDCEGEPGRERGPPANK